MRIDKEIAHPTLTFLFKKKFEGYVGKHAVKIHHYHCNNTRFADNMFKQDAIHQCLNISYCDVNVQLQNGISKKRIKDIQDQARKPIIHTKMR